MGATSFNRHRRAVAAKFVRETLGTNQDAIAAVMEKHGLTPADMGTLEGNNDVLSIADSLVDDIKELETLGAVDMGPRRTDSIADDVRDDQFEDRLQHPKAETVGVGNMNDGPEQSNDALNVAKVVVDAFDGDHAKAGLAVAAATDDALANHGGLPKEPVGGIEPIGSIKGNDGEVITTTGVAGGPALVHGPEARNLPMTTDIDVDAAAKDVAARADDDEKLAAAAGKAAAKAKADEPSPDEAEIANLDTDGLRAYAAEHNLEVSPNGRTKDETLRKQILSGLEAKRKGA